MIHVLTPDEVVSSSSSSILSQSSSTPPRPLSSPKWANLSSNWGSRAFNLAKRWYINFCAKSYSSRSSAFNFFTVSTWSGRNVDRVMLDTVALCWSKGTAKRRLKVSSNTYWLSCKILRNWCKKTKRYWLWEDNMDIPSDVQSIQKRTLMPNFS